MLRSRYPDLPISNADARRVVIGGAARVNGRVVTRPGSPVGADDRVSVSADRTRLARTRQSAPARVRILFEDADLLAVDKPAGLAMHRTADPRRPHLVGLLASQLRTNEADLGVHQRLDAGTSGVVLLARSPAANRGLARSFAQREAEKVYLALVDTTRRPDLVTGQAWTERRPLGAGGSGRQGRRQVAADAGTAPPAETAFVVRHRHGDRALIEARPRTGRLHQIRAHLSAADLPIVGDPRYGGPAADRLCLHAWRITLAHPVTEAPLTVDAPVPSWATLPE